MCSAMLKEHWQHSRRVHALYGASGGSSLSSFSRFRTAEDIQVVLYLLVVTLYMHSVLQNNKSSKIKVRGKYSESANRVVD